MTPNEPPLSSRVLLEIYFSICDLINLFFCVQTIQCPLFSIEAKLRIILILKLTAAVQMLLQMLR